jgi:Arc/MetJ-type ribon-helix-helix transcriptional regulator
MQETITLTLPPELSDPLKLLVRKEGTSADDLIFEAIREYLFIRQFRSLRERLILKAQEQSIYTDQDVFDRVS